MVSIDAMFMMLFELVWTQFGHKTNLSNFLIPCRCFGYIQTIPALDHRDSESPEPKTLAFLLKLQPLTKTASLMYALGVMTKVLFGVRMGAATAALSYFDAISRLTSSKGITRLAAAFKSQLHLETWAISVAFLCLPLTYLNNFSKSPSPLQRISSW